MAVVNHRGPKRRSAEPSQGRDMGKIIVEVKKDELDYINHTSHNETERILALHRHVNKEIGILKREKIKELAPPTRRAFEELLVRLLTSFDMKIDTPHGGMKLVYRTFMPIKPTNSDTHLKHLIANPDTEEKIEAA